jgi:hypothetical protein
MVSAFAWLGMAVITTVIGLAIIFVFALLAHKVYETFFKAR